MKSRSSLSIISQKDCICQSTRPLDTSHIICQLTQLGHIPEHLRQQHSCAWLRKDSGNEVYHEIVSIDGVIRFYLVPHILM